MEYNKFELWLSENLLEFHKFDSLGGKATFKAKYNRQDGSLTLRINKRRGGFTEKLLKKTDIVRIFERWRNASPSDKKNHRISKFKTGRILLAWLKHLLFLQYLTFGIIWGKSEK